MNRRHPVLASRLTYNRALLARIEANAVTNEDRALAILNQAHPETPGQGSLFHPQHANPGVASRGQPDPAGCVHALSRKPE